MQKSLKQIEVKSIKELRAWLEKNHTQSDSVWLVTYKKNVTSYYIEYAEIVDELLCFGWIDSLPRKLDEDRKMLRISPRNPKSAWSKINRDKASRLIKAGRMTEAGLKAIKTAKDNGAWDALKTTDSLKTPQDLKAEFSKHPQSKQNFEGFPPSTKRALLEWIAQAKTTLTREKRVSETARLAAKNIRANQYRSR